MAPQPDPRRRPTLVALTVVVLFLAAAIGAALAAASAGPRTAAIVEPTTPPRTVRPPTTVPPTSTTTAPGFQTSPTTPSPTSPTTQVVDGFHITKDPTAVPVTILYTIQPGDTLTAIAAKFDQRGWGKLFVTNWVKAVGDGGIQDPNLIFPGRIITVTTINGVTNMTMSPAPGATTSTTTGSTTAG